MEIKVNGDQYCVRFYYTPKGGERKRVQISDKAWNVKKIKKKDFMLIASKAILDKQKELDESEKERKSHENKLETYFNKFIEFQRTLVKESSCESKERRLRLYFLPFFGKDKNPTDTINSKSVSDYRVFLSSKDLSNETANHILSVSREFIEYLIAQKAVDSTEGYAMKASLIYFKKSEKDQLEEDEEVGENFWTKAEFDKFMSTFTKDDPYRFFFYISFWCATRIGETLGLKFSDFNEKESSVSICRARNTRARISTTKTASSKATITIPKHVFKNLKEYKELVEGSDDDFLFFPTVHGARTTIRRKLSEHIEISGLKKITPHGFRHSMASYLLVNGFDYMDVCKYLRHASPETTLQVYAHWIKKKEMKEFSELGE